MPTKVDLVATEKEAWDNLLEQIDKSFIKGKIKSEETENLTTAIKTYKVCHTKRFNSEKKGK